MKRKTVLRSIIASATLLSLTACGQANLTAPTANLAVAPSEVSPAAAVTTSADAEPAEYPAYYDNSMKTSNST